MWAGLGFSSHLLLLLVPRRSCEAWSLCAVSRTLVPCGRGLGQCSGTGTCLRGGWCSASVVDEDKAFEQCDYWRLEHNLFPRQVQVEAIWIYTGRAGMSHVDSTIQWKTRQASETCVAAVSVFVCIQSKNVGHDAKPLDPPTVGIPVPTSSLDV